MQSLCAHILHLFGYLYTLQTVLTFHSPPPESNVMTITHIICSGIVDYTATPNLFSKSFVLTETFIMLPNNSRNLLKVVFYTTGHQDYGGVPYSKLLLP